MKRKKTIFSLAALALVSLALIGCNLGLSGAGLDSGEINEAIQSENIANDIAAPAVDATGLTAGTNDPQTVEITFSDSRIDESTIGAISFNVLGNTRAEDGAYTVISALTPTATSFEIVGYDTVIEYTFDLSNAATVSSQIEIVVDASVLTAENGSKLLDTDDDDVRGENPDDSIYEYIGVTGAGITAVGSERDPRATIAFAGETLSAATVGATTFNMTIVTDNITAAILDAGVRLVSYNATSAAWDTVSYTSTLNTATNTYALTIPEIVAGAVYRIDIANPYTIAENTTTNGFARRFSNDQNVTLNESVYGPIVVPSTNFVPSASTITTGVTTSFDERQVTLTRTLGYNGVVTINFDRGVIGIEGLNTSTVTPSSILVYNGSDNEYVPVTSVEVRTSTPNQTTFRNDVVDLTLDPTYIRDSDSEKDLEVHIAPTVQGLGGTADTADDVFLGDQSNVGTTFPFGQFRVILGGLGL